MGDVGATLKFLEDQPWADMRKVAITGFCWGGKVVWNACETYPEFKAGVSWYGPLAPPAGARGRTPAGSGRSSTRPNCTARCWGSTAARTRSAQSVPAMREALAAAGKCDPARSSSTRTPATVFTPTTAPATTRPTPGRLVALLAFFAVNGVLPRPFRFG